MLWPGIKIDCVNLNREIKGKIRGTDREGKRGPSPSSPPPKKKKKKKKKSEQKDITDSRINRS